MEQLTIYKLTTAFFIIVAISFALSYYLALQQYQASPPYGKNIPIYQSFNCKNTTIAFITNCTIGKQYVLNNLILAPASYNQTQIGIYVGSGANQTELRYYASECQTTLVDATPINKTSYRYESVEIYLDNYYNGTPQSIEAIFKQPTISGKLVSVLQCQKNLIPNTGNYTFKVSNAIAG